MPPTDELSEFARTTWQVDGEVNVILPVGNTIYIGGEFNELVNHDGERLTRNYFAAIDRRTGEPTSFNPDMSEKVWALVVNDGVLFAGGSFIEVGGVRRQRLAAFDLATGELTDYQIAAPNNVIRALATDGDRLYVGGLFEAIGSAERIRLAAFDVATGDLDPTWTPEASAGVKGLIVDPDKIWVGGDFFRINNIPARGLTTVDLDTGALLPIESPSYWAVAIAAEGNQVFVAGGGPGGTAAAFNRTTGEQQWSVLSDGNFQGVNVQGDWVYLGGHHTYIFPDGERNTNRIATGQMTRHNRFTGELDENWLPFVNGVRGTNAVAIDDQNLYIGGDFTFISRERQGGFAIFTLPR